MSKVSGVSPRKKSTPKWHRPLLVALFVVLNIAVIVATAVSEFGNSQTAAELSEVHINWWLLIPAVICFILATFFNVLKYVIMMQGAYGKGTAPRRKDIWRIAWRTVMLGKYYDNVTPAAVGGQPFQILYMRRNSGLTHGYTTSIPFVGMIAGQIGFLIIAIFCFLFGGVFDENPALLVTAWVGLLVYAFWPVMVAGISFFPKATAKLLQVGVKMLAKIKIVKHRAQTLEKVETEVAEYADAIKMIMKTRGLFLKTIVLATLFQFLISTIPYFVLEAFGGDMDFFKCLATTMAVTSAVYFVPTPGNSVAAEGTFFAVFSSLSTGYVFWAMLMWRFFSYYIYIIIGPLIYLKMRLEKKRRSNKNEV